MSSGWDLEIIRKHTQDRKSTRLNSSHLVISYAVFCLKKKNKQHDRHMHLDNTFLHIHPWHLTTSHLPSARLISPQFTHPPCHHHPYLSLSTETSATST